MCEAPDIIEALLEDEEGTDPKDFLLRHPPQRIYRPVAFYQDGPGRSEAFQILDELGEDAVIAHLAQNDFGGDETFNQPPWGDSDSVYWGEHDGTEYALSVNHGMGYIGLCAVENRI